MNATSTLVVPLSINLYAPSAATTKDGAADLSKVKETVDTTNLVVSYTFVDLGGVTSVTFTASNQLRISSIVITYGE